MADSDTYPRAWHHDTDVLPRPQIKYNKGPGYEWRRWIVTCPCGVSSARISWPSAMLFLRKHLKGKTHDAAMTRRGNRLKRRSADG